MGQLYIVEGLPCSGKSTTSAFISEILKENNQVCFVDEGSGNHPADYEFHAFISDIVLAQFEPEKQELIKSCSVQSCNGYVAPLSEFKGELFDWLLKYKIYDFLAWKIEMPVMLDKWRKFVENADKNTVYVFNCVFLQNPMCETMMRFGFSEEQSFDYISKISEIISPMKPAVIYLKNDDIRESVEKAASEREGWLDEVINYHVNGAYGKSVGAKGFDGYISCIEERQKRELSILEQLSVDRLIVDNPHRDWSAAYEKINDFIKRRN